MFTCFFQVSATRQLHVYLFHSSVDDATTAFLLVSFKTIRVLAVCVYLARPLMAWWLFYLFHSSVDVATTAFLLVSFKLWVQATCRFLARPQMGLEALFCTKRSRAHETFLQTCFVGVRCGCYCTCLHEILPQHNSLRHKHTTDIL